MSTKTALVILISMVALAIGLGLMQSYGAPPKPDGVNAAQFTNTQSILTCPTHQTPTDLQVTLTTEGRPVVMSFTVKGVFSANSRINLIPFRDTLHIDQSIDVERIVSAAETDTLQFTKIVDVAAGTHTFRVDFDCQGVLLGNRWLTVWELGSGR